MAIRLSMLEIIARMRLLVGDPAPTDATPCTPLFTDDQLQDFLDEQRQDERYEVVQPKPTYAPGGIVWSNYYSQHEHWEANETLIWTDFTALTPDTPTRADRILGRWGFAAGQLPAILLAGSHYDVWAVAANLLDIKIVNLAATSIPVTIAGSITVDKSKIVATLQAQAAAYRAKAKPQSFRMVRSDVANPGDAAKAARVGVVNAGVPFITGE